MQPDQTREGVAASRRSYALSSMSTPKRVKEIFRAGESREKCLLGQRAHKVAGVALDKMSATEGPGGAPTPPATTQEVESPMPDKSTAHRFTVYAVSRDCHTFTSDDGIPFGHRATFEEAKSHARSLDANRACYPTRIVERQKSYPFEVVEVVWRCDE